MLMVVPDGPSGGVSDHPWALVLVYHITHTPFTPSTKHTKPLPAEDEVPYESMTLHIEALRADQSEMCGLTSHM